ncbi:MAG: TauD/TfdA family dioxygenase [Pseudomonadota bacterium]
MDTHESAVLMTGPTVWRGAELVRQGRWSYQLGAEELAALAAAIATMRASGRKLEEIGLDLVRSAVLEATARTWLTELNAGRGFIFARGLDQLSCSDDDAARAYWALGLHMGTAVPQSKDGELLGHVRDIGADPADSKIRLYKTRKKQDFHVDGSDIVGLLCLKRAQSGGLSRIVGSMTIYNHIAANRPDLLPALFAPMHWDIAADAPPGHPPTIQMPICSTVNGHLRFFYIGWYIRNAQQYPDVPRLSGAQEELLALIESCANDPANYLDMDFQPGDMQFLKNSVILHSRTEYDDAEQPELKRHLLRLWLTSYCFDDGDPLVRKGFAQS